MNRLTTRLTEIPHLDLLPPSRRLWRLRFGSVALANLEKELLGVRRTEEDIPGWLIPTVYNDYLRSGDASEIGRVFYHNQLDMLSMVTLTAEIMRQFSTASYADHPTDLLSLGKWQAALGMNEEAERSFRMASAGDLPLEQYHQALKQLGKLLKRGNRRKEAVPIWQQWAATSMDDVEAHIELAMHFEWQERDLNKARMWTEQALALVGHWTSGKASVTRPELEHRIERLKRKIGIND
jgi:Flp pilus assembly protein TadD